MLNRSDLDLNNFANSSTSGLKQIFRQTMINQELEFMRQVQELHRLYKVQLDMTNTTTIPEKMNDQPQSAMVDLRQLGDSNLQHERHALHDFTQKPLDLQLSADEFISHFVDDFQEKIPVEPNNFSRGVIISDQDSRNLSLTTRQDVGYKDKGHESFKANKATSSSTIIDLEDPNLGSSKDDTFPYSNLSSFKGKNKLEDSFEIEIRGVHYGSPACRSSLDIDPSFHRDKSFNSGLGVQNGELLVTDFSSKNQTSGTCKENIPDLNMSPPEGSSCFSNMCSKVHNQSMTDFSGVTHNKFNGKSTIISSSSVSCYKTNVKHQIESLDTHQQIDLNYNLNQSPIDNDLEEWSKDDNFRVDNEGETIDLNSDPNEHLYQRNSKLESEDSTSKSSNGMSCDINIVNAEANVEGDANLLTSLIDNHSSSLKTVQSVAKCESPKANIDHLFDNSGEHDQRSSDTTESRIQLMDIEDSDVDDMVRIAAESLVQISLQTRDSCDEKEEEKFGISSESYEAMVFNAKECDPNEYFLQSNAFTVDEESVNKGCGYKLKRGTRMKNFQKDILPCMSVLSRQEIHEDINLMKGVIRSREYKKMKANMGNVGDLFTPTRSKRSRVGCSKRYYP